MIHEDDTDFSLGAQPVPEPAMPRRPNMTPLQRAAMNAIAQSRNDENTLFRTAAMVRAQAKRRDSLVPGTHLLSVSFETVAHDGHDEAAIQELATMILGAVAAALLDYLPMPESMPCVQDRIKCEELRRRLMVACGRRRE